MNDIFIETVRAVVTSVLFFYLWYAGTKGNIKGQRGWSFILGGFALLVFGMIIDITDNLPSLDRYVVVGNTVYEAFLEKVVGYLGGFSLLAIGFWKWMPTVIELQRETAVRKQSEDALRESEEKYRVVVENASEAIVVIQNGIVEFANKKAFETMGYSEEEMIAKPFSELLHPDEREIILDRHYRRMRGEEMPSAYELKCLTKGGVARWAEIHVVTIEWKGMPAALCFLMEITERKQMEEALRMAKEAAETASRAKSLFLATMSHEIRTPMSGVLSITGLLLDTELTGMQRRYVETAHNSAEKLLAILNDILDVSKVEAGKLRLDSIAFEVRQTVEEVIELLYARSRSKGVDISLLVHDDVPRHLRGDPVRLRQILLNLVMNAIKFTERGEIAVTVSIAEGRDAAVVLRFTVADTGVGIAADALERIFYPFSQECAVTCRREGTGLGLTICRQLVEMMGGEIGVESEPGKGSTFWFTVRVEEGCHPDASARPAGNCLSSLPSRFDARLLLAEDNPINQDVQRSLLESLGCHVDIVANGREAVETVLKEHYDLVFMDCRMPEMNGFDAARAIRNKEAQRNSEPGFRGSESKVQGMRRNGRVPIIALTGNAMQGDREECLAAGMDDYLSKPFNRDQLRAVLRRWLHHETPHEWDVQTYGQSS